MLTAQVRARVAPLFAASARLSSAADPAARAARQRLAESSRLSPAGVELALALSLEKDATDAELAALASSVPRAPAAHVLLSANVFVATQRALALALVAASRVFVRASRREPEMARFYAESMPGSFEIVDQLRPAFGDLVFAYGGAEALRSVVPASLDAGAGVRAYGPGFGLEVCAERAVATEPQRSALARAMALDAVLFDQRGCLSPRLILFQGERASACRFAESLCAELESFARDVPLGFVDSAELAEIRRYHETLIYAGELFTSAAGSVGVAAFDAPTSLSPAGRTLHIIPVSDAARRARELAESVTTVAVAGDAELVAALTDAMPEARITVPGWLQRPAFDGPVDRRAAR